MSKATDQTGREFVAGLVTGGMALAISGFGLCDIPYTLVEGARGSEVEGLTTALNDMGIDGTGLGILLGNKQVTEVVASYVGGNKEFARQCLGGKIKMKFIPQDTLAEQFRAGGAGIPAFYIAAGVSTLVAEGKPHADFDGRTYMQGCNIVTDVGLVHTYHGDIDDNLVYHRTVQNFNPLCAASGEVTVTEVEHLLGRGEVDPDRVMAPGMYIQHIVHGDGRKKLIEKRTTRPCNIASSHDTGDAAAGEEI